MKRLTYFDEDLQEYRLIEDTETEELICVLGMLEDFKESHEMYSYADYIISIRKKRRLTQEQFAKLIHETRSNLANYESRACKPPKDFWYRLNNYAYVPLEESKSLYRRIEHQIDDDSTFELIETGKDDKAIAEASGRLLKAELKFYDISKSDFARALSKYIIGGITPNRLTKFENGKTPLTPWMCGRICAILEKEYNIQSDCLRRLERSLLRINNKH